MEGEGHHEMIVSQIIRKRRLKETFFALNLEHGIFCHASILILSPIRSNKMRKGGFKLQSNLTNTHIYMWTRLKRHELSYKAAQTVVPKDRSCVWPLTKTGFFR